MKTLSIQVDIILMFNNGINIIIENFILMAVDVISGNLTILKNEKRLRKMTRKHAKVQKCKNMQHKISFSGNLPEASKNKQAKKARKIV